MSQVQKQLALQLLTGPQFYFGSFFQTERNSSVVAKLRAFLTDPKKWSQCLYLSGPRGVGKSHLLQASCHEIRSRGGSAIYLPMELLLKQEEGVFQNLSQYDLVAIDDFQLIQKNKAWEEGVFHLFNQLADSHQLLMVSADQPLSLLEVGLADLRSRLASGLVCHLEALRESEIRSILIAQAEGRGLSLPLAVVEYLFHHFPRDLCSLLNVLNVLDQASWEQKRNITIPLINQLKAAAVLPGSFPG